MKRIGTICAAVFMQCAPAYSDITASASVEAVIYEDLETSYVYKLKVGTEDQPVYVWGSYEQVDIRLLGQPISDSDIYGLGVGVSHSFGRLTTFAELGYGMLDSTTSRAIRDEVVYTQLLNAHAVGGRVVPAEDPQLDNDSQTLYELGDGIIGRVGLIYTLADHIELTVGYRFMTVKEHYELWSDEVRFGKYENGWWQESVGRDLSAWEAGIVYYY